MNRHEGVSCDSCLKNNFRGRRYKCLICYDYDLCSTCFEAGTGTNQHSPDHPMQCILTKSDFDLYYGGEALGLEQPQSYTCPLCNRMGFTDATLVEHVTAEHADSSTEVVCPICASMPGGEPNLVTDDFPGHLTVDHRTGPRDLISFLDEPSGIRHSGVSRVPSGGRGRARRPHMQYRLINSGSGGLSPASREPVVDPIAELLSQLSGVRRAAAASNAAAAAPSQLQQLQMQLQLERHQLTAARQQVERLPRRGNSSNNASGSTPAPAARAEPSSSASGVGQPSGAVSDTTVALLTPYLEPKVENAFHATRAALVRGLWAAALSRAPPSRPPAPRPRPPPPKPAPAPPPRAKPEPQPQPQQQQPQKATANRQRNNKSPPNQ